MNKTPQTIQLHTCHSVAPALSSGAGHQPRTFTPWDGRRPFPPGKNQRISTFLFSLVLWSGLLVVQHAQAYYAAEFGRWINRDPMAERGGNNLYRFCYNEPSNILDPFGLKAKTLDEIAADEINKVITCSTRDDQEYCGSLCRGADGVVFASKPSKGFEGRDGRKLCMRPGCPAGSDEIGAWHTHGDTGSDPTIGDPFSDLDKNGADHKGNPLYLGLSNGGTYRYDPDPARKGNGPVWEYSPYKPPTRIRK